MFSSLSSFKKPCPCFFFIFLTATPPEKKTYVWGSQNGPKIISKRLRSPPKTRFRKRTDFGTRKWSKMASQNGPKNVPGGSGRSWVARGLQESPHSQTKILKRTLLGTKMDPKWQQNCPKLSPTNILTHRKKGGMTCCFRRLTQSAPNSCEARDEEGM